MTDINFNNLIMQKDEIDLIIYHGGCVDGFASAFSAYKYFSSTNPTKEIIYYPGSFDKPPPDVSGKNVCLCDFTYKKPVLDKMIEKANKLIILDHHKTAQEDLESLPDENKIFRMDHSGAYITWSFFHPDKPIPKLILYVEDTDIWTKKLPNTNEISTIIHMTEKTFEEYDKLLDDDYLTNKGLTEGVAILKNNSNNILQTIQSASPKLMTINQQHYFVCYLNSSVFKSEIGNKVFDKYPDANFSAIYSIDDYTNSTIFSLRSLDNHSDVSRIAKLFGGGGHRNASGVRVPLITSTLPGLSYDNGQLYSTLKTIYTNSLIVNNKQYNIVYANLSSYKSIIARYLLQIRYFEKNDQQKADKPIQECISILRNKNITNIDICHVSYIWNYDGYLDKTWVTLNFSPFLTTDERQSLVDYIKKDFDITNDDDDDEQKGNRLVLSGKGLIHIIE
jgi:oligoribonuclease NrnB/cAMP/cGMP phosphodiesterase (DHH superfamily)